ncbi:hypothetical protein [Streptomyces sp. NPDC101234]|uniref:hypothetical protein n=1 Tax=Streptomyces sp. NPDC101234 TaxID=3366138 RepID=UPI003815A8DC
MNEFKPFSGYLAILEQVHNYYVRSDQCRARRRLIREAVFVRVQMQGEAAQREPAEKRSGSQ